MRTDRVRRTSKRSQSGSRANKKHKHVATIDSRVEDRHSSSRTATYRFVYGDVTHDEFHSVGCLSSKGQKCNCNPHAYKLKLDHKARAQSIDVVTSVIRVAPNKSVDDADVKAGMVKRMQAIFARRG